MGVEGWKVGDPYVQSLSIRYCIADILLVYPSCARKSVCTHRGDDETDREDMSSTTAFSKSRLVLVRNAGADSELDSGRWEYLITI